MSGLYLGLIGLMATLLFVIAPPATIKPDTGIGAAFLVYLASIFLKVLLDDAAHFADKKKNGQNWAHGLGFSILWNLFVLDAIRVSTVDFQRALVYAVLAQLIGTIWIIQNYLHKAPEAGSDEQQRHTAWAYINIGNIAGLVVVSAYASTAPKEFVIAVFIVLSVITLYDFLRFGTLKRVRDAFS